MKNEAKRIILEVFKLLVIYLFFAGSVTGKEESLLILTSENTYGSNIVEFK